MPSFKIHWTKIASEQFLKLENSALQSINNKPLKNKANSSKQEGLFKQVYKTINFLSENPKHPSLNTHEYSSLKQPFDEKQKVFEAYAQNETPGAYRIFCCYGPGKNEITLIAITPHP